MSLKCPGMSVCVRYADLAVDSKRNKIFAIRESHSDSGGEPKNELVSIGNIPAILQSAIIGACNIALPLPLIFVVCAVWIFGSVHPLMATGKSGLFIRHAQVFCPLMPCRIRCTWHFFSALHCPCRLAYREHNRRIQRCRFLFKSPNQC